MRHDRPLPRQLRLGLALALALPSTPLLAAAESDAVFGETVDVDVVNVEVVVTDGSGAPVSGLEAGDFAVFSDGEQVELSNFYAVDRRSAPLTVAIDEGSATELPAEATRRLHLILLVDRAGLQLAARAALFDSLEQSLDRAFELDGLVMLASLDAGLEVVVPFTSERQAIRDGLERLRREAAITSIDPDRRAVFLDLDSAQRPPPDPPGLALRTREHEIAVSRAARLTEDLIRIAEREAQQVRRTVAEVGAFLDGLAGLQGRKAVLFLSGGLAIRPGDGLAEVWRDKFQRWIDTYPVDVDPNDERKIFQNLNELESARFDTSREVAELGRRAAAQRVAFYPVARLAGWGESAEVSGESFRRGATLDSFARESALSEIAGLTGGKVWSRTQAVGAALELIARDSESYYSLGFPSPGATDDGKFHGLEVKVRRPGLEVRHVAGYVTKDAATRLREATVAALYDGGSGGNPLGIRLESGPPEPSPSGAKRSILPLSVFIPYKGLFLLPDADSHRARLSLVVVVRDLGSGKLSEPHEIELPVRIPNDRLAEALTKIAVFPLQLDAGQGPKEVAVGIRDQIARVESTSRIEVR